MAPPLLHHRDPVGWSLRSRRYIQVNRTICSKDRQRQIVTVSMVAPLLLCLIVCSSLNILLIRIEGRTKAPSTHTPMQQWYASLLSTSVAAMGEMQLSHPHHLSTALLPHHFQRTLRRRKPAIFLLLKTEGTIDTTSASLALLLARHNVATLASCTCGFLRVEILQCCANPKLAAKSSVNWWYKDMASRARWQGKKC